jgi:hypothetical protein
MAIVTLTSSSVGFPFSYAEGFAGSALQPRNLGQGCRYTLGKPWQKQIRLQLISRMQFQLGLSSRSGLTNAFGCNDGVLQHAANMASH